MGVSTIKIFDVVKITYLGEKPDIELVLKNENTNGFDIELKINNIIRHNFDKSSVVYLQAYNSRGASLKPWTVGTLDEILNSDLNEYVYTVPEFSKEDTRFRFFVSKEGKFKNTNVSRIIGLALINNLIESDEDDDDNDKKKIKVETLLPISEDEIGPAFKVEMKTNEKPKLILRKDCKFRLLVDNDSVFKTLIYTAAIRELLTTYLTETQYDDCIYKNKWMKLVSDKLGEDYQAPTFFEDDERLSVDPKARKWIENAIDTMVSELKDNSNRKLIEKFKTACVSKISGQEGTDGNL